MGASIAALIGGGLGIGIGWGLARRRYRSGPMMVHRLVLAQWEDRPRVRRVSRPVLVDWSTQPAFDPAHHEGAPS